MRLMRLPMSMVNQFEVVQNFTTQPNSRKVTPSQFTDDTISIVKYITNYNWMITTTTILCVVLLLLIRTVQATVLRTGRDTSNSSTRKRWSKWTWLGTKNAENSFYFEQNILEQKLKENNAKNLNPSPNLWGKKIIRKFFFSFSLWLWKNKKIIKKKNSKKFQSNSSITYRLTNVPRRTGISWRRLNGGEMDSDKNLLWLVRSVFLVVLMLALCAISLRANSLASFQLFSVDDVAVVVVVVFVAVKLSKSSAFWMRLNNEKSLWRKSGEMDLMAFAVEMVADLGVDGASLL